MACESAAAESSAAIATTSKEPAAEVPDRESSPSPEGQRSEEHELDELDESPSGKEANEGEDDVSSQPLRSRPATNKLTENEEICRLLAEQRRVREDRKRIATELKNAQRRRKRLKHRARLLSNDDLSRVMQLREIEKAEREAKAKTSAKAVAKGASSSGLPRT